MATKNAINSTQRKLALSGWLYETSNSDYNSPFKHQKFLFFYEALAKVSGDEYEFSGLKGYKHGPVFSAVWGDRNHEADVFLNASCDVYRKQPNLVDAERAMTGLFIVQAFTMDELIRITHSMNIWNAKKDEIDQALADSPGKAHNIPLFEDDFSNNDSLMISKLATAFPFEFIKNAKVIAIERNNFIFTKEDAERLTPEQYDVLIQLYNDEDLENPVYAYIDEDGTIIVD